MRVWRILTSEMPSRSLEEIVEMEDADEDEDEDEDEEAEWERWWCFSWPLP